MKAGQAAQALGHYSAALAAAQPGSAAFAAVLHANRAAAQQALGAHVAAVSDCLRATALDPGYAKVLGPPLLPGPIPHNTCLLTEYPGSNAGAHPALEEQIRAKQPKHSTAAV
jgi:hypothetical protein